MKKKSGRFRVIICFEIIAVIVLVYYNNTQKKAEAMTQTEESVESSKVQDVLLRNLDSDYPPSPKEVVKFYSEISQCMYGEQYTENELTQMADQQIKLFDEELAANNPKDKYLVNLKSEIASMKQQGVVIYGYTPSSSTDVEYFTKDGRDCARLYCTYSMSCKKKLTSTKEIYVLRKDDSGHWKIYGWQLVKNDTEESTEAASAAAGTNTE